MPSTRRVCLSSSPPPRRRRGGSFSATMHRSCKGLAHVIHPLTKGDSKEHGAVIRAAPVAGLRPDIGLPIASQREDRSGGTEYTFERARMLPAEGDRGCCFRRWGRAVRTLSSREGMHIPVSNRKLPSPWRRGGAGSWVNRRRPMPFPPRVPCLFPRGGLHGHAWCHRRHQILPKSSRGGGRGREFQLGSPDAIRLLEAARFGATSRDRR